MSVLVTGQPLDWGTGPGDEGPSNLNTLKRLCNCFLIGEDSEGRKTIVTTDHLSRRVQP